ncbi:hypothetical protein D9756_009312 [Leucocoprinus leucothites]|uniref:Uncharacterized protein n=1 Tax=Leucocoprinus leucothites TaxID=201217 RepID=A0A8H5CWF8_9AGAR|nr:hypothetical protein D9756_009312 [Leucoagaricus leucothites]
MSDREIQAASETYQEDWDKSLVSEGDSSETSNQSPSHSALPPRNSIIFPAATGEDSVTPSQHSVEWSRVGLGQSKRTLSELLKVHAEKGTDCRLSQEEATRLGEVLGQWINASSSPYEGEDDFFKSQDDIDIPPRRGLANGGRPRGQSECISSRPSSSAGFSTA